MSNRELVVIGKAVKAFGIRGEVKIKPFTESLEVFEQAESLVFGMSPYKVLKARIHKGAVLATLEGIDTPEKAKELAGSLVKTDPENIPSPEEDEYYWFELIGMRVFTLDGRDLGEVTQVIRTGANDVLQVEGSFGEVLIPVIEDVVIHVDTDKGEMTVDPLDGLIPDA